MQVAHRKTESLLRGFPLAFFVTVDALLENGGRLEHHHATRRDRHLFTSLRIAPDPLALLAYDEGAERRQFHRLPALEAIGDFLEHEFHQGGGFRARQSHFLVDRLTEVGPRHRFSGHRLDSPRRDILLNYRRY